MSYHLWKLTWEGRFLMKKIIVEARLLSRSTGISGFFDPLLQKLIKTYPNTKFILTTQSDKSLENYKTYSNVKNAI